MATSVLGLHNLSLSFCVSGGERVKQRLHDNSSPGYILHDSIFTQDSNSCQAHCSEPRMKLLSATFFTVLLVSTEYSQSEAYFMYCNQHGGSIYAAIKLANEISECKKLSKQLIKQKTSTAHCSRNPGFIEVMLKWERELYECKKLSTDLKWQIAFPSPSPLQSEVSSQVKSIPYFMHEQSAQPLVLHIISCDHATTSFDGDGYYKEKDINPANLATWKVETTELHGRDLPERPLAVHVDVSRNDSMEITSTGNTGNDMGKSTMGYRFSKYNPSQWHENNYSTYNQSFVDRDNGERIMRESKFTINETEEATNKTQTDVPIRNFTQQKNK